MRRPAASHRKLLAVVALSAAWFGCTKFTTDAEPAEAGLTDASADSEADASDGGPAAPFLLDTFTRTEPIAWGSADIGGAWTLTGPATVAGGVGRMAPVPGKGVYAFSDAIGTRDMDMQAILTASAVGVANDAGPGLGGGLFIALYGRCSSDTTSRYVGSVIVQSGGVIGLGLVARVAGVDTSLVRITVSPVVVAGEALRVRFQIVGASPTRLRGKVWKASESEPTFWPAEAEDSTPALQQPGRSGASAYLSNTSDVPVVTTFDELTVRPLP